MPSDASIQELPHLFGSPCRLPFDSLIQFRGLGDMVAISRDSRHHPFRDQRAMGPSLYFSAV
jgi:hypothetical protein